MCAPQAILRRQSRFGRILVQNWVGATASQDTYVYTFDRDGNVLSKENWVAVQVPYSLSAYTENYTYNAMNQLIAVSGYGDGTGYTLDANGNITAVTTDSVTTTRTANSDNQLVAVDGGSGAVTITYDNDGNMTEDDQGNTYTYDAWNRLVAETNSDGVLLAAFTYDGMGRRITETVVSGGSTASTNYYFSGMQDIEEAQDGYAVVTNIYSPTYVNAILLRNRDTNGDHSLDEQLYFTHDANENITAVLNTSGTVEQRMIYGAYGKLNVVDKDFNATVDSYDLAHLWQGMYRDQPTGLYDTLNRVYDVDLMVWLTVDPAQADGNNWYIPDADNPINLNDSTGLRADPITGPAMAQALYFERVGGEYTFTDGGKMVDTLRADADVKGFADAELLFAQTQMKSELGPPGPPDKKVANVNFPLHSYTMKFGLLDDGYCLDGMLHGSTINVSGALTGLSKTTRAGNTVYKATYVRNWSIDKTFLWHSHGAPVIGFLESVVGKAGVPLLFHVLWSDSIQLTETVPCAGSAKPSPPPPPPLPPPEYHPWEPQPWGD